MRSFDPQALTSLTCIVRLRCGLYVVFRSTGSYEPDRKKHLCKGRGCRFDPQALTSLTAPVITNPSTYVSFDPQALTSLTTKQSADG